MRRPRNLWAKTLTLTAALLAVVWVVHMRMVTYLRISALVSMSVTDGAVLYRHQDLPSTPDGMRLPPNEFYDKGSWSVEWWARTWRFNRPPKSVWRVPLWPFVLLTGVPGVWMLVKTRKRTNPNACPACGYDRTGLPQPPTGPAPCPECGKSA